MQPVIKQVKLINKGVITEFKFWQGTCEGAWKDFTFIGNKYNSQGVRIALSAAMALMVDGKMVSHSVPTLLECPNKELNALFGFQKVNLEDSVANEFRRLGWTIIR